MAVSRLRQQNVVRLEILRCIFCRVTSVTLHVEIAVLRTVFYNVYHVNETFATQSGLIMVCFFYASDPFIVVSWAELMVTKHYSVLF